jgi:microcystin-dependent protein
MSEIDAFVAEIRIVGFSFAPTGWAFCDGQLMPISQNTALFSLIGTTYGGDGKSTFALPDMRNRAPMHPGQGQGLSNRVLGEFGGQPDVTLGTAEIHQHNHAAGSPPAGMSVHDAEAESGTPSGAMALAVATKPVYGPAANLVPMGDMTGGSLPHNNRQPYLGLHFVIALQGIFPPRWPASTP